MSISSKVAQISSKNPFRTPTVTPNPTGASAASSSVPSYATPPPSSVGGSSSSTLPPNYSDLSGIESRPPSTVPPSLPPRASSTASDPPAPASAPPSLEADTFPDAAPPPAYTITPDVGGGELLVQQGPRRPFQRAPEPFLPLPAPQVQVPEPEQQLSSPARQQFAPPPGAPPGQAPPSPSSERPRSQLSDFARDFYSALPPAPSDDEQGRQPQFAPPPGAPPPRRPRAASTSSGAGSTAPPTSDGRPTTTPTPGHPLLRNGQTLVYPENYNCPKCHNTGYKNNDPSHPCRKCWDRFGKPFTSILASSPWNGEGSGAASQSQRGRTFQRPLPAFRPPQARPQPPRPMPGAYPSRIGPPPGMQRCGTRTRALPAGSVPPPGATVVMPGDPRIGGRLCWRCGGRGTTPFLIFDEVTCETCGGIGRLVN